ncbi:salicylic acid-binding protein 2-like protein [Tanacetum coccineum]
MEGNSDEQKHFVLVHGACHGAWCWFKLKPLLEAMGHRVSAFDLLASGTNTKVIQQVHALSDYTMPLLEFMAALPPEEKVVLVGHSLGGINISLAMEKFSEKISLAVFLSAFMPDYVHEPSYVLDKDLELGKILVRPSSFFLDNLHKEQPFSAKGYGSVTRVCAIAMEDKGISREFQQWMISNSPVTEVKELKDVDHMLMLSDPKQVCVYLADVALQYA